MSMKIAQINQGLFSSLSSQRTNDSLKEKRNQQTNVINSQTIPFEGMTKKLKKHTWIDGQKDIKPFVDERIQNGKSTMVGQLPKFMLEKLPIENRKEAIMDIYNTFSEITEELRNFDETKVYSLDEIQKRRNKSTVEKYEKMMRKYNFIGKWDDADLEYLGKGGKGAAYKLVGLRDKDNFDDDEFVIKVFHVVEGENWQYSKSHGCYAELNSAAYWMNTVGADTNRGKFYFGDLKSGYMINKYIDEDVRLPKRVIDPYQYGLKCTDEDAAKKHNVCKGYSYDWGGVRVVNRLKNGDKYARKILETIKKTPERYRTQKWLDIYDEKVSNYDSRNAGLAMAIKHMPDKLFCFDKCMQKRSQKVDQGLAYALKYLPYEYASEYFEKLVQTNDVTTQIVLFNEIPLLAMKHRDENLKDDLQTMRSEILPTRVAKYYDIAEKYALPESIEHLASFLHLLPKDKFRSYYRRLAGIDNYDLHDRMLYKFSSVEPANRYWAALALAKNVTDPRLEKRLLNMAADFHDVKENSTLRALISANYSDKAKAEQA